MLGQALSALRVIELGDFYSAAYSTKLLADMGAEVVKIERPGSGDTARRYGPFPNDTPHPERSGLFLVLNTNKLGITLDVAAPPGRRILLELLSKADVLVENNPPRLMADLGLDYQTLSKANPRLIMTSITPFGQTGPYKDYRAYHLNVCAAGGACLIGTPDSQPLAPPLWQAHVQGAVHGAVATMVALLARELTGTGQHVDVSEADVWATWHEGRAIFNFVFFQQVKSRTGHRLPGFYPCTALPCKDGYVVLNAVQGYQWKKFLEIIGEGSIPDWYANDPRFKDRVEMSRKYADELDARIAPWLMAHTRQEIFDLCQAMQVPFGPVNTIGDLCQDPHLQSREYFVAIEHPEAGVQKYPGAPYRFSETPWSIRRPAPRLGEHNEEVYGRWLGYRPDALVALWQTGVI